MASDDEGHDIPVPGWVFTNRNLHRALAGPNWTLSPDGLFPENRIARPWPRRSWVVRSTAGEAQVNNRWRAEELDALVAERAAVEVVEESFAASQKDGHHHQVHLVDQASAEVLLDGGRAAANPHVVAVGGLERSVERRV